MALRPEAQAILQLLADVMVNNGYAESVVAVAQGKNDSGGQELAFAQAPAELTVQVGADGTTAEPVITVIIGDTQTVDLLSALRAVLKSYQQTEDDPA
jgi:hypothetical protein